MITAAQCIVRYEGGRAIPDRLTRAKHAHYLDYARQMLAVYRSGAGRTRRDLHQSIQNILAREPDCEPRKVPAFCKLLDDASEFADDRRGQSSNLRLKVFELAARHHPLVTHPQHVFERGEMEVKQQIAAEIGQPWPQIESQLYADVLSFQPLIEFKGYPSDEALLSRYNVAQLQACLYRARNVIIRAKSDFKTIVRHVKLARLLHEIRRIGENEYQIDLSGPATVLHETRRYGVNFARFVPALLACREWTLKSQVSTPWGNDAVLLLSSEDGYSSHLVPPDDFDSSVEADFAADFGSERDGWRLVREAEILHDGQVTFVPDFVMRHEDGRSALLEIVGFWTPEYLEKKRQTVRQFKASNILLAVEARLRAEHSSTGPGVIFYKKKLAASAVIEALHEVASLPR